MPIRSLAVFCGSHPGKNPSFTAEALALGALLAEKNIGLIYGGGNIGLMGLLADAVMKNGGKVTGIIPRLLVNREKQHENITELIIAADMHERKKTIYEKCDAALAMPGGYGTLDELFEMLTWNQLSIHDKKIFILNTDGFYDNLIAHIRKMEAENFLYDPLENRITVVPDTGSLRKLI
jgi:uncharacterized protein (TIGR00730 family)